MMNTTTPDGTNTTGVFHDLNITGIPPECDASDESLTIFVDGDTVELGNGTYRGRGNR